MQFRVAALISAAALLFGACGSSSSRTESSISLSPTIGAGPEQIFTAEFPDPEGAAHLEFAGILINEYMDGRHACYVNYVGEDNSFRLVKDSGEGATQMQARDTGELSNSQCRLAGSGSSATLSGNRLKLVLDLRFDPGFAGKKQIFLASRTTSGKETPLVHAGAWTVGATCPAQDSVTSTMSVAPASGSGGTETFHLTYSSPHGAWDLVDVRALFNRKGEAASACYVVYNVAARTIGLANDDSSGFTTVPLQSGQMLANSQCSISTAESSVTESQSALDWKLRVSFKPSFAGKKDVYLYAATCNGKDTGTQKKGTWAVPYGNP